MLSMKKLKHPVIFLVVEVVFFLLVAGCNSGDDQRQNIERIYAELQAAPADEEKWDRLIQFTSSTSFWESYNAYSFIAQLSLEQNQTRKIKLVEIFKKGAASSG